MGGRWYSCMRVCVYVCVCVRLKRSRCCSDDERGGESLWRGARRRDDEDDGGEVWPGGRTGKIIVAVQLLLPVAFRQQVRARFSVCRAPPAHTSFSDDLSPSSSFSTSTAPSSSSTVADGVRFVLHANSGGPLVNI